MSTVDMLKGYFAKKVGRAITWVVQKERTVTEYRIEVIGLDGDTLHAGMEYRQGYGPGKIQAGDFQVMLREGMTRELVLNMLCVACDPYFDQEDQHLGPEIKEAMNLLALQDEDEGAAAEAVREVDTDNYRPNPFPLREPEGERLIMTDWMERGLQDERGRDTLAEVRRDLPADPDTWFYSAWAEKNPVRRIRMLDASARLAWTYARDLSKDFYYQHAEARTFVRALELRFPSLLQVGRVEEAMETARALMKYDARRTWGQIFFGVAAVLLDDEEAMAEARTLLDQNNYAIGAWPWARLLVLAASEADEQELAEAAEMAMRANKHVPKVIDGKDIDPISIGDLTGAMGSPTEAIIIASPMQKAWKKLGSASEIVDRALSPEGPASRR